MQCDDDQPFMTHFSRSAQLSFSWAGHPEAPIEVSYGGFGEPVVDEFGPTVELLQAQTPRPMMRVFYDLCEAYIKKTEQGAA